LADAAIDRRARHACPVPVAHFQAVADNAVIAGKAGDDGPAGSLVIVHEAGVTGIGAGRIAAIAIDTKAVGTIAWFGTGAALLAVVLTE
jgi:hypothetical protein